MYKNKVSNQILISILVIFNILLLLQLKHNKYNRELNDYSNLDISNKLVENQTSQLKL